VGNKNKNSSAEIKFTVESPTTHAYMDGWVIVSLSVMSRWGSLLWKRREDGGSERCE
jgi:hypothetical protein